MRAIGYEQARKNLTTRTLELAHVVMPFRLRSDDRFFFFGSCTARQMESSLRLRALDVLSTSPALPPGEVPLGSHVEDRYYAPVMTQEIAWACGQQPFPTDSLVAMPRGMWADLQLPTRARSVSRERALERRRELERYFARVAEATVAVIDLCGADLWFDRETGIWLNAIPPDWFARRRTDRFEYQSWDHDDCYESLRALRAALLGMSPITRIIVTVNRQRRYRTFRPTDVTQAMVAEQSTLLSATAKLVAECEDVAYFPMFEAFSAMQPRDVYDAHDHVRQELLDASMAAMLHAFGVYDAVSLESDYDEAEYLRASPTVEEAVRAGTTRSAYHHWYAAGRPQVAVVQAPDEVRLEPSEMRARIVTVLPSTVPTDRRFAVEVEVENRGPRAYEATGRHPVSLCYRWYDADGRWAEVGRSLHTMLRETLMPGTSSTYTAAVATPQSAGRYVLAMTMLQHDVAWFDDIDPANGFRGEVTVESWDGFEAAP